MGAVTGDIALGGSAGQRPRRCPARVPTAQVDVSGVAQPGTVSATVAARSARCEQQRERRVRRQLGAIDHDSSMATVVVHLAHGCARRWVPTHPAARPVRTGCNEAAGPDGQR